MSRRHHGFQVLPRLVAVLAVGIAALSVLALAPAIGAQVAGKPPLTWVTWLSGAICGAGGWRLVPGRPARRGAGFIVANRTDFRDRALLFSLEVDPGPPTLRRLFQSRYSGQRSRTYHRFGASCHRSGLLSSFLAVSNLIIPRKTTAEPMISRPSR